jgi:hypothetical protein
MCSHKYINEYIFIYIYIAGYIAGRDFGKGSLFPEGTALLPLLLDGYIY